MSPKIASGEWGIKGGNRNKRFSKVDLISFLQQKFFKVIEAFIIDI